MLKSKGALTFRVPKKILKTLHVKISWLLYFSGRVFGTPLPLLFLHGLYYFGSIFYLFNFI